MIDISTKDMLDLLSVAFSDIDESNLSEGEALRSHKILLAIRDFIEKHSDPNMVLVPRALLDPIVSSTPSKGNYKSAEIKEESDYYDCPCCEGEGYVSGKQYINFDGLPLNVLFSGIGNEFMEWQVYFDAVIKQREALKQSMLEAAKGESHEV